MIHNVQKIEFLWLQKVSTKGQLISKCLFGIFNYPKTRTKKSTLLVWVIKLNCFHSLTPKHTFRN